MSRIHPEYLDAGPSDRRVAADVILRQEPEEEEDDGDDDEKEDEDEGKEEGDGYSE